jgi:hypothetical protein
VPWRLTEWRIQLLPLQILRFSTTQPQPLFAQKVKTQPVNHFIFLCTWYTTSRSYVYSSPKNDIRFIAHPKENKRFCCSSKRNQEKVTPHAVLWQLLLVYYQQAWSSCLNATVLSQRAQQWLVQGLLASPTILPPKPTSSTKEDYSSRKSNN